MTATVPATLAGLWLAATWGVPAAPPAVLAPGDAARGQRLLANYQCGSCHQIPGAPSAQVGSGPSLLGMGRRSFIAGQVPNQPATLARWLQQPQALVPGTLMPSLGVGPADARDMAAYLWTLQ